MIYDEPGASLARYKGPRPLQEDAQAKAGGGQELEVNESPSQPRRQSAHLELPALQYGKTLADDCHGALVEITKRDRLLASGDAAVNEFSRIMPALHGHLRHAGKRFAVLFECRGIANHKDFGMSGYSQIFLNAHSPRAVRLNLEPLTRGRRRDTGGPNDGLACDALTCNHDAICIDLFHTVPEPDFDAQTFEVLLRSLRELL